MAKNSIKDIIGRLSKDISDEVGNSSEDELTNLTKSFDDVLNDAISMFNTSNFNDDGFIKKMEDIKLDSKFDQEGIKHTLESLKSDYIDTSNLNQSEVLLRRDIFNICTQMPEMRDVIYIIRDAIIECNVATGEVSRTITFDNINDDTESYLSIVKELEEKHDIKMRIKNTMMPKLLMAGENYIHIVAYAKLFAQVEALADSQNKRIKKPFTVHESTLYTESHTLYTESNMQMMMGLKVESEDPTQGPVANSKEASGIYKTVLENIVVCNNSSVLIEELGFEGACSYLKEACGVEPSRKGFSYIREEVIGGSKLSSSVFGRIDDSEVDYKAYEGIKGCYIKYLDGLRMIPVRMDNRIVGYYYITTTMDLAVNPAQPNGIIDLSFQKYVKDKNVVDRLADLVIKSFDKKMLEKNIRLKNEIAQIIVAHKFADGKLSFIFIPENEIVRLVINEDENSKGHSVLEPTIFPARNYLMLNLYNLLFTLNNITTRVHYLKTSGMNKNYSRIVERAIRKFQSRRITIDDIYSYQGVLNKVGGIAEMVIPAGRGDYKAIETDTIEAVNRPIDTEYLEQQRRQAITGTGVPQLLVINAIDEVDFAKTLEMANARYISTVSAYKIDANRGITLLYRKILRYETDLDDAIIQSFHFKFNTIKQQELNIDVDMINNFNTLVELAGSLYYKKNELEDENGNTTFKGLALRRELAKKYLPQLDFDEMDEVVKTVNMQDGEETLKDRVSKIDISNEEIEDNLEGGA